MYVNEKDILTNNKFDCLTVKALNKPTKDQARNKIKELSEFLSKTWHMPINSE